MREGLVPAAEARRILLEDAQPTHCVRVPIQDAGGRTLCEDLEALRTQPPFPVSAMDGYAISVADIKKRPTRLRVVGTAAAGRGYGSAIKSGETVRIFTGAPVPDGADAILIQENARRDGDIVMVEGPIEKGLYVRPAGLDFKSGDILLRAGDTLDAQRLSLAASMNHAELPVWRRPVVALMATGDELTLPGSELGPAQIIASNTYGLAEIIRLSGGAVIDLGIVADTEEALVAALESAIDKDCDLIVTTGGASVGDHDLVLPVLDKLGASIDFTRLAMRPGKPMLSARLTRGDRTIRFLGLAGNPVSSLVAGHMFLAPLVGRLCGRPKMAPMTIPAVLGCDLPENDQREDYMRASLDVGQGGELVATAFQMQDSSMLATLTKADALIVRPAFAPSAKKGEVCQIIRMRG